MTALVPKGWWARESLTLVAPDGQANVIASSEPLDPSIDVERYAKIQGDRLREEFFGYREIAFDQLRLSFGRPHGLRRRFEWNGSHGEPMTQVQLYHVENGRGYVATATTPSRQIERFEEELQQALGGLLIGDELDAS